MSQATVKAHDGSCLDAGTLERNNVILEKEEISPTIFHFLFKTPEIAKQAKAGQFVVVRVDEQGERVPLTIADFDREKGTLTLIAQVVGASTLKMSKLNVGDTVADIVGPLGRESHIEKFGTVVCVGGGVGVAPVFPIARELFKAGNRVLSIIGARSKDLLIWEDKMKEVSTELFVTTDDGTYGRHGFVTDQLKDIIESEKVDLVLAIGPVVMMRAVSNLTKQYNLKTIVSLNSIMIDGTGMCGGCRIGYGEGGTKFVCVDGPEFDAHQVDFKSLMDRQATYTGDEKSAYEGEKEKFAELENLKELRKKKTPMPEQPADIRRRNFEEVPYGYTEMMAYRESLRCLQCKNKPCVEGCPVNIDIPTFISQIAKKDYLGAVQTIKKTNALPAVCGRVCPQESQCESLCVLGKKNEPVAIGRLERFVADYEAAMGKVTIPEIPAATGFKIAVVGAGPAGLTVAADMRMLGHEVHVFEALHKSGGVLVYGIPEFRLPKSIVEREVDYLRKLGVHVHESYVVGKTRTVQQMFSDDGFHAMFIASGAGLPMFMNIPGENLNGVYSANEFLTRANLMKAYRFPEYDTPIKVGKKVAIIGGGNVAMDSARVALRLGADEVHLVYRRSMDELPARAEEVHHAKEEGIIFDLLQAPVKIDGDEKGWVKSMEVLKMELGEPDASGRRRPVPVKGSNYSIDVDVVVVAIGTSPNPLLLSTLPELKLSKWGTIEADEETGQTSMKGVYAGGDIVTGAATVISAMGAGKKAAAAMNEYLKTLK
ncbi:MAG TPA: bifunctional dihydroorotate dehydrogenase B NAD binding subunit/NADPH-dependent glutamate synthase [bacterium]|nr:bifunctional dihydroorotate dehydrogenase B NAD binding subunit/NADPH-dependent glutamate synthase [bacterium]